MNDVTHYSEHVGTREGKPFKATLHQTEQLMLGLNVLTPGQTQHVHVHDDQAKFYFVLEGEGDFTVGDATRTAGPGHSVWAAPGVPHGVHNPGPATLVLLVGIAPAPPPKS